ncbi:hypothetical protein [Actinoplanes derwentensis]|uniref:hypothetical protein n=1 Tax=Actinoplanes derwentensis TaxID=113562 RepID=UPI000B85AE09|nr:hypothetical protein [Actinoplanes derwentensis]GID85250.1 hypothetical protein Ade03nite_41740 [Actinoplanes derwentensis]
MIRTGLAEPDIAALAARIEDTIVQPVTVDGVPVAVGASIGVLVPAGLDLETGARTEDIVNDLLRTADVAMYEAKRDGGGTRLVSTPPSDRPPPQALG